MRLVALASLLLLAACPAGSTGAAPPTDVFYWPTGLVHVPSAGGEGVLFVANANFDKRFESGNILAIDLDAAKTRGLPAFGADVAPQQVKELAVQADAVAQVPSFTGELIAVPLKADKYRLFVPSRSEGMQLAAVDATVNASGGATLKCATPPGRDDRECFSKAPSLVANERTEAGVPRAPSPFGVAWRPRACTTAADCVNGATCVSGACQTADGDAQADVFVSHIAEADSPYLTGEDYRSYLVRLTSDFLELGDDNFTALGPGASYDVVAGKRWAYVSGRISASALQLVRLVGPEGVYLSGTEATYRVRDARGLALSADERHLYVIGRQPDALVSMQVGGADTAQPALTAVNGVNVPDSPTTVRTIPRPGRSDLVVVVCTDGGVLAFYDDDAGALVGQVAGIGEQPFDVAIQQRGAGARLFVSNFGDGRVAVVDIRDLSRPQEARVVGHLGAAQKCLGNSANDPSCTGGAN